MNATMLLAMARDGDEEKEKEKEEEDYNIGFCVSCEGLFCEK